MAQGLQRLAETNTWKQWQWDASSKPHTTAASFRQAATQMITFKHLLMPCQTLTVCVQAEFLVTSANLLKAWEWLNVDEVSTSPQDCVFGATSQQCHQLTTDVQYLSSHTSARLDHPDHLSLHIMKRAALCRSWVLQQRMPHALQILLQQAQESTASTEALHKLQSKL